MLEQEIGRLMLEKYADNFILRKSSAKVLFMNRYGIYVKDENGLTGVILADKDVVIGNDSFWYHGYEYKINGQIPVILSGRRHNEFIFTLNYNRGKSLVKKK